MRYLACACALAIGIGLAAGPAAAADNDIRLSGCLVRGQDGEGYLLTNVPGEAAWQRPADATVLPGPVGTSGTVSTIFYWLDKRDGLDDHVGHEVEIEGRLRGDLKDGQIRIEPQGDWTNVSIEADGQALKAKVPRSLLVVPAGSDRKVDVLVRRVEPQRVRMLAAVCGR
jgi:hypothetical protein